ncbi:hypothetical protein KUTeg_002691 [Tegillarca granosa]|uniref:Peptidase M13 C-terminal domain-containing protein n=1 Tax=Tegillarca granosa TaxID=220873 RepID=A0ABQ9FV50_TEGGR|nr:hypothetical protein KUTeg_002691 [Tegillarca granosa]
MTDTGKKQENEKTNNLLTLCPVRRWGISPAVVNAYYNFGYNRIMFPAGILQPPYYHKDQPKITKGTFQITDESVVILMSLSYGGIGSLIGHEITHGFDDQEAPNRLTTDLVKMCLRTCAQIRRAFLSHVGSQYDKYGNLNQWWDDVSASKFKERAMCMVKQYMNYTLPEAGGMRVRMNYTLPEAGGMRVRMNYTLPEAGGMRVRTYLYSKHPNGRIEQ